MHRPKIGFSVYRLEIRDRNGEGSWTFQHGAHHDGFSAVANAITLNAGRLKRLGAQDPDTGLHIDPRALKIVSPSTSTPHRIVTGILLQGESGVLREVHNFNNPDGDPTYTIKVEEGALTPLYFRIHLEDGRRFGVAILQTFGHQGMKGIFETFLRENVTATDGTHPTIRLVQLVDRRVLTKFARTGQMQDVVLVNSGASTSSREAMRRNTVGGDQLGNDGDKLELRLKKKDGWTRRALLPLIRAVRKRENPFDLVETDIGPFDDMMIDVLLENGRQQRFSLLNPDDSPIRYDKTKEIQVGSSGLPSFYALDAAAIEVWESVKKLI